MRRRILVNNQPSKSAVLSMNVVFANKSNGVLSIAKSGEDALLTHPSTKYVPIGVVVIPSGHGVLKDEKRNQSMWRDESCSNEL